MTRPGAQGHVEASGLGSKNGDSWLFRGADLVATPGSLVAVDRSWGRGRVPLLLTLSGRLRASEGRASVAGYSLQGHGRAIRRLFGLGEMHNVNDLDRSLLVRSVVKERIALALQRDRRRETEVLDRVGLRIPLSATVEELTAAERLLLGAALALVDDPLVVALDGLGNAATRDETEAMWRVLRDVADGGTTVLAGCVEPGPAALVDAVWSR